MSNCGIITTPAEDLCVYLHMNAGIDSVKPMLLFCKVQGARSPARDNAGWGSICQTYGNLIGCGRIGAVVNLYNRMRDLDTDQGTYVIDEEWNIVKRIDAPKGERDPGEDEMMWMIEEFDRNLPERDRLPLEYYRYAVQGRFPEMSYEEIGYIRRRNSTATSGMKKDIRELFRPADGFL